MGKAGLRRIIDVGVGPGTSTCNGSVGGAISVTIPRIPQDGKATVTWIAEAIDPGFGQVCGQADVAGLAFTVLSDDPQTPAPVDATCRGGLPSNVLVFFDDFESGDLSSWSASLP